MKPPHPAVIWATPGKDLTALGVSLSSDGSPGASGISPRVASGEAADSCLSSLYISSLMFMITGGIDLTTCGTSAAAGRALRSTSLASGILTSSGAGNSYLGLLPWLCCALVSGEALRSKTSIALSARTACLKNLGFMINLPSSCEAQEQVGSQRFRAGTRDFRRLVA